MNKEAWFQHYERMQAEHPELSDIECAELARDAEVDEMAARVDQLHDEEKHGDND